MEKYETILLFNQIQLQKIDPLIDFDKLKGQMVEAARRLHENYNRIDEETANELIQRLGAITELPNEVNIPNLFRRYPDECALVGHVLSVIDADAGEGDMENHDVIIARTKDGVPCVVELVILSRAK